jgi:hypothetical protein
VWSTAGNGIELQGGAFDVRHATTHGGTRGLYKNGAWAGDIVDSIAWAASTANFQGFVAADVRYSDAVGALGGLGNINVDPLFIDSATGNLGLQVGSPCIGTGDPFSELDADCSSSDMGAYPRFGAQAPAAYCVGKTNSVGCTPYIGFSGYASASSTDAFIVRAFDIVAQQNGIFFYGTSGATSTPFQGGTICVASPTLRTPIQNAGGLTGAPTCTGVLSVDFNAWIQSNVDAALISGATVNIQAWYRDPGINSTTGLSNALQFGICN